METRLVLMAVALMMATGALARPTEYEPQFHEITMDVVTPHVQWGRPYYRGSVRGLMIAPRPCHRDTVELAQRLDLEFDQVGTYLRDQLGGGEDRVTRIVGFSPEDVKARMLEKLSARHDVIVVGNLHWEILPQEVEYEILRQVRSGVGLVLTYHENGRNQHLERALEVATEADDGGFITHALPLTALPAWEGFGSHQEAADALVDTREFGEGRMVLLNLAGGSSQTYLTPPTGSEHAWKWRHPWPLEYYLMLTGRAVLWAAGMEPDARIAQLGLTGGDEVLELPAEAGAELAVRVTAQRPHEALEAELTVRGGDGEAVGSETQQLELTDGEAEARFALPEGLAVGRHFAEVIIREQGGCVTWGAASFVVRRPRELAEVSRAVDFAEPGGEAAFRAVLDGPAPAGSEIRWRITDSADRLLHVESTPIPEGEEAANLRLRVEHPLSNVLIAEAELRVNGERWARQFGWLPVDLKIPPDEFSFLVWGNPSTEYVWRYVRDILREHGVDTMNHGRPRETAADGMRTLPAQRVGLHPNEAEEVELVRKPCLSGPEHRARCRERLQKTAEAARGFGVPGYTLGDDNRLGSTDICFSEHCLADLRDYLRQQYDSLQALNAQWGTQFGEWGEATPITLQDARESDQPSRWIDHRMHMESVYADFHAFARDAVREIDPEARVGSDAAIGHGSFGGYDWWKYSRAVDVWNVYVHLERVECLRAFKRPETYCGLWYGGYNHIWRFEEGCRWVPWYSLLHELNSAWWFKIYSSARERCQEDAIAADLTVFPIFEATADAIAEIRAGIDRLLLNAERDNCGVAVVYSQPSLHAATFEGEGGRHSGAVTGCLNLLEDLGLQYDLVSYAQLDGGEWGAEDFSAVILPDVTALSEAGRRQIEAFVSAGGALIADLRPGVRDGHGRPVDDPRWDRLFGVRRRGLDGREAADRVSIDGSLRGERIAGELEGVSVDGGVIRDGARALGSAGDEEMPICLVSEHGEGFACLLNFGLGAYGSKSESGAAMRGIVGGLLRAAEIAPLARVEVAEGELLEGEVVTFRDGRARYVAVLRDHTPDAQSQRITVSLPEGHEVYNVREGQYLGRVTAVEAELGEGEVLLLALLPYQPAPPEIALEPAGARPGEAVSASIAVETPNGVTERHVAHVTVRDPSGAELACHARDVVLSEGRGTVTVPLALNAPTGAWTLRARDVATGQVGEAALEVAAPEE
ncbi:MAG: beta-galactosidase [Armatimonadota bacterium]|nr:beta-galactosidase [Armatimonadota bacterium]